MKQGVYLLNKDEIEEEFSKFSYVPEKFWDEIQFDEVPLYISRKKIKKKGIPFYQYDVKRPFLQGYIDGWSITIKMDDIEEFEKAFRPGNVEKEWVEKLHMILMSK